MNKLTYVIILVLFFTVNSCVNKKKTESKTDRSALNISTDLQVDHFNIWVKNPKTAKKKLRDIGFTSVPDSLSAIHKGQGTTGRYFYFLNNYLELIFVYDQTEFKENNRVNRDLDFAERANFDKNGASPFSVALKVKDYDIEKIPFKTVKYHQEWMDNNENIYSAVNSKTNLKEPSVFVVYPELESDRFETLSDLKNIPEEYAFARTFYKHPNGAKKVTNIKIISPELDMETQTIKAINGIENLSIKNGAKHLMELTFDNNIQGKIFDLRPELPLIIKI
ncbi:VOC family protein [Aquimarina sp. D1M17]|uniref:VOC family protein n=1 Tax=Aquimarina acroporae TaxID=2937283 RepID=UPI0020BE9104|nr:VOC family protein [Aquimarina acroporae]MCK8520408.1 VOC family protein [Aquimarina acroporae]